jgi:site-specific recombinase XerC
VGVPTINHSLTALRFLFMVTLRQPDVVVHVPFVREPRRLPVVLSPEEVARLLEAAPGLKYRAALSVAYGAGPRASEVVFHDRVRAIPACAKQQAGRLGQPRIGATVEPCIREAPIRGRPP